MCLPVALSIAYPINLPVQAVHGLVWDAAEELQDKRDFWVGGLKFIRAIS